MSGQKQMRDVLNAAMYSWYGTLENVSSDSRHVSERTTGFGTDGACSARRANGADSAARADNGLVRHTGCEERMRFMMSDAQIEFRQIDPVNFVLIHSTTSSNLASADDPRKADQERAVRESTATHFAYPYGDVGFHKQINDEYSVHIVSTPNASTDKVLFAGVKTLMTEHFDSPLCVPLNGDMHLTTCVVHDASREVVSSISCRTVLLIKLNKPETIVMVVDYMCTRDAHRGQGLASALYGATTKLVVRSASEINVPKVYVSIQSMRSAINFWSRHSDSSTEASLMVYMLYSTFKDYPKSNARFPIYPDTIDMLDVLNVIY